MQNTEIVLAYHERTKHHSHRYAAGPGYLDWENQPNPFRTYRGAEQVPLPLLPGELPATFDELHAAGAVPPRPLDLSSVAALLELSLGLSAWKEFGSSRWALRCNPSSGNLHPTEGYVVTAGFEGLPAGVYHYVSRDHLLERRCGLGSEAAAALATVLPPGSLLVGLTSIHWRESWKYGERAFRYCQHDAGHAIACVRYAAAALGWAATLSDGLGDEFLGALLGLDRPTDVSESDRIDREHPDTALIVAPRPQDAQRIAAELSLRTLNLTRVIRSSPDWQGVANALSEEHVDWDVIDAASEAARKPHVAVAEAYDPLALPPMRSTSGDSASRLIRQRRSAVSMDGTTGLDAAAFYAMLDRLLPRGGIPPWDVWPWRPHVHCGLLVHRVKGLEAGLYLLERDASVHESFRESLSAGFAWSRPADCPTHLRLFLLKSDDFRNAAQGVSCGQEIAADGAFSLGMLAEFGETIRARGAWWWRRLFWEAGIVGQTLYLEAEAAGVRGTGIGCYFDDSFHELLGLRGDRFQSLYHFTIGGPVEDTRLRTIAPYAHRPDPRG